MEWIKFSKYNLPPQGLKIVCFRKGDVWIARRINYQGKDYYLEFVYGGKEAISTDVPDYWMQMDLPQGCTGYMRLAIDESEPRTFDELQRVDPASHEEFMGMMIRGIRKEK